MPAFVVAIVGLAAILHAAWNVILKTAGDPLVVAFRLTLVGVAVSTPLVVLFYGATGAPRVTPEGVALAVVSGVIEAGYFIALSAAYRRGDLSVVYPIARGSAPLLAVVIGTVVLGERLEPIGWAGVACLLIGILLVSRPWRSIRGRRMDGAVGFALLTGAAIATYSAVDRVGVQHMSPGAYGIVLFAVATALIGVWMVLARRRATHDEPAGDASWGRSAAAGLMAVFAYILILVALSLAPLIVVAPLRESAIVLVSGWGAIRLGEAADRGDVVRRLGAAVLVVVGIALLVIGA